MDSEMDDSRVFRMKLRRTFWSYAKLLHVQPSELKFPFQLNRVSTCWLQLTNKTNHNVAFKVKTTHPRKYCVRPNVGVLSPGSTSVVKVGLQAQKEFPLAVPKDKFLIQSIIAPTGVTVEDITSQMFRKDSGGVEEQKLRVIFVTADPPSPIPEGSEEECSPGAAEQEYSYRTNYISALFDSASTVAGEFQELLSEGAASVQQALGVLPDDDRIVHSLFSIGTRKLQQSYVSSVGTAVHDVIKKFGNCPYICEYKYDGERAQVIDHICSL